VKSVDHPSAQAIFVSCTDLRALEVVNQLEELVAKPVLTSNQVTFWGIAKAVRISQPLRRFGTLFERKPW
jgi:maleate isomerase